MTANVLGVVSIPRVLTLEMKMNDCCSFSLCSHAQLFVLYLFFIIL